MSKQLIISYQPFEVSRQAVNESLASGKPLTLTGILQRGNAFNQNGRIYPKEILEREVNKYMDLVKERRAMGELDHPESSVINLSNVSHIITEMHWDGDDLIGTIEVLGTPSGNILKALLASNVKLGISSRGLGSVQEIGEGKVQVMEDFELICFDMVSTPSTQGAFMNLKESINKGVQEEILKFQKFQNLNLLIQDFLGDFTNIK
jgi:hypothetical protein